MTLFKCPECGKEISDKEIKCQHCGFPITRKSKTINKAIIFCCIGVALCTVLAILGTRIYNNYKYGRQEQSFRNVKLGMTVDDIIKAEKEYDNSEPTIPDDNAYLGYENKTITSNIDATLLYYLDSEERLSQIMFLANPQKYSESKMVNYFDKLYGEENKIEYKEYIIWVTKDVIVELGDIRTTIKKNTEGYTKEHVQKLIDGEDF